MKDIKELDDGRVVYHNGTLISNVSEYGNFKGQLGILKEILKDNGQTWSKIFFPEFALRKYEFIDELKDLIDLTSHASTMFGGFLSRLNDYNLNFLVDIQAGMLSYRLEGGKVSNNIEKYIEFCKSTNTFLCNAVTHPHIDRRRSLQYNQALKIVAKSDNGITVSGARLVSTMAPICDEVIVHSIGSWREEDNNHIFSFAVPLNSKGITIHVRRNRDQDSSPLNEFIELDATIVFEDVFVPTDRIFFFQDV